MTRPVFDEDAFEIVKRHFGVGAVRLSEFPALRVTSGPASLQGSLFPGQASSGSGRCPDFFEPFFILLVHGFVDLIYLGQLTVGVQHRRFSQTWKWLYDVTLWLNVFNVGNWDI